MIRLALALTLLVAATAASAAETILRELLRTEAE
jgi:hypothetical protein